MRKDARLNENHEKEYKASLSEQPEESFKHIITKLASNEKNKKQKLETNQK